jgi:hypothetical protein
LPVLEKAKTTYKQWLEVHRNIERTARFGIGNKIDELFLDLLELLRKTAYTPINKKLILLEMASDKIDSLRFFFQLLWEAKLVSNKQYISLGAEIENIGRIIGGWKRGLISKTSALRAEEKKQ